MTTSVLNNNSNNSNNNNSGSGNKNNSNSSNTNNNSKSNNNNNNNSTATTTQNSSGSSGCGGCADGGGDLISTTTTTTTATTPSGSSTTAAANRSMQSDEDFNIRFVNLVRMHKCLYDKKVPEYRNRDNQEKAWTLISQETCENVMHCKERWRNLRACLSRYIKQQSGADPQHKPYYLTEHMSFLLPFLKSTRNSLEAAAAAALANNSNSKAGLAMLMQFTQHQQQLQQQPSSSGSLHVLPPLHMQLAHSSAVAPSLTSHDGLQDMKHSLSENEETIDAFDPVISASLQEHHHQQQQQQQQQQQHHNNQLHLPACSPPLSDTASANSIQHFIPDVQLAELRTPEPPNAASSDMFLVNGQPANSRQHQLLMNVVNGGNSDAMHEYNNASGSIASHGSAAKRIKTECNATNDGPLTMTAATTPNSSTLHCYGGGITTTLGGSEHAADMDFFRSIMPDIAALTPQQKRKLKIGILELIDDVVDRFPGAVERVGSNNNCGNASGSRSATLSNGSFLVTSDSTVANGDGGSSGSVGGNCGIASGNGATGECGSSSITTNNRRTHKQQRRNSNRDWRK